MKRPELDDVTDVSPKREVLRASCADAALVVTPHPVTLVDQRVYSAAELQPGETLGEILVRHGVPAGAGWHVCVGGLEVPEALWARVRVKPGHLIEARAAAQDNDTLRLAAFVALMYFSGGGIAALGGGNLGAALYFGAGSFLINKLLPPKQPDMPSLQNAANFTTYSVSGGRNRARLFEPMALVLGEPHCVPDLAAQPYTYFADGEQYLWQLFHAGINCAAVGSIKVGQTPIENYQGVEIGYEGFATGNTGLPLLSNVDTVAGGLLDAPASPGAWVTRTSSANAVQIAVDLEANLYSVNNKGTYVEAVCELDIEYRLVKK